MGKKRVNVTIDEEVYKLAKQFGINISAFLENRLKELLLSGKSPCGGRDLNPRTPTGGDLESPAFGLARQPPHFLIPPNLIKTYRYFSR